MISDKAKGVSHHWGIRGIYPFELIQEEREGIHPAPYESIQREGGGHLPLIQFLTG